MLLAHVVFFHHALQPVAFGFESGQPGARCANLAGKNHCSIRIIVQFASTGGRHLATVDRPPLAPNCRRRNWETCAAAALSTHRALDRPLSTQPPPYRRAGTALHLRSCSHTAKPRSRYRRPPQNIWSIRSSCRPTQPAAQAPEFSPQSSARLPPPAESESPACWCAACETERCETTRMACA